MELYQKLINGILGSSKVTKSDHFPGPPKIGSETGIYPGSQNRPILTNLIKQTSKYKKYYNSTKIKSKLLLKLYKLN